MTGMQQQTQEFTATRLFRPRNIIIENNLTCNLATVYRQVQNHNVAEEDVNNGVTSLHKYMIFTRYLAEKILGFFPNVAEIDNKTWRVSELLDSARATIFPNRTTANVQQ